MFPNRRYLPKLQKCAQIEDRGVYSSEIRVTHGRAFLSGSQDDFWVLYVCTKKMFLLFRMRILMLILEEYTPLIEDTCPNYKNVPKLKIPAQITTSGVVGRHEPLGSDVVCHASSRILCVSTFYG